jgi:plasmid stability protein
MEAEAREILAQAVSSEGSASPDAIQAFVRQLYDEALPDGVVDELIQERRREAASEE